MFLSNRPQVSNGYGDEYARVAEDGVATTVLTEGLMAVTSNMSARERVKRITHNIAKSGPMTADEYFLAQEDLKAAKRDLLIEEKGGRPS